MPMITTMPTTWSAPVTLTADEVWQVRGGPVFVSTDASPDALAGLEMKNGDAIRFSSGKAVRYRSYDVGSQIVREEI